MGKNCHLASARGSPLVKHASSYSVKLSFCSTMSDLKRLSWLQAYAAQATGMAGNIYTQARAMVPGFAEGFVNQVEDTTVSLAAPYLTLATDSAAKVLSSVDAQVDKSLALVEGVHSKNLATFNGAKEQCYSYVEGTVQQAKSLLDPTPYLSKLAALADPDKIVDTSFQYLDPVAGKVAPYVPEPVVKTGLKTYTTVHDTVVSLPLYKTLWDLVWSTSSSVQDSWAFKKAMEVGYPYLAPVADPVVSNISNSKYLKQLTSHLQPAKAM